MKALVFTDIAKMEYKDFPSPVLDSNHNVRVKIGAVGVCGSDVQGFLGKTGRRLPPMIMGHEMAGIVEEVFSGSYNPDNLKKGDKVVILPFINCGECDFCKQGKTNFCTSPKEYYGILSDNGGMCDEITIDSKHLVRIPAQTDITWAALAEPMAVAYSGAKKVSGSKDEPVLLFGAGTIGLLALTALRQRGYKKVVVTDANKRRLEKALVMGAWKVLLPDEIDSFVKNELGGKRFKSILDAVGINPTYSSGIRNAENGAELVWVGNVSKTFEIPIPELVMRELSIKGSFIYNEQEIREAINLITSGNVDFNPFVELKAPMSQGVEIFNRLAIDKEDVIKAVLVNE